MRKFVVWFSSIVTSIAAIWRGTLWILDQFGRLQSVKDFFEYRREILRIVGDLITSPWASTVTFLAGGGALLIALFYKAKKKNNGLMQPAESMHHVRSARGHEKFMRAVDEFNAQNKLRWENRNEVLNKMGDLIRERRSAKPNTQLQNMFGFLVQAGAHQLSREDDVVMVCDQLVASGNNHPFKIFEKEYSPVIQGEWLDFLQAFQRSGYAFKDSSAWAFAVTHWRGKDRWLTRPKPKPRSITSSNEEQVTEPIESDDPPSDSPFDTDIRSEIELQLGNLISNGEELQVLLMAGDQWAHDVHYKFSEWEKKCEEFLTTSFNEETLRFFRIPVPSIDIDNPLQSRLGTGVEYQHVGLFEKIASRVHRLRIIRTKLKSGELDYLTR